MFKPIIRVIRNIGLERTALFEADASTNDKSERMLNAVKL